MYATIQSRMDVQPMLTVAPIGSTIIGIVVLDLGLIFFSVNRSDITGFIFIIVGILVIVGGILFKTFAKKYKLKTEELKQELNTI